MGEKMKASTLKKKITVLYVSKLDDPSPLKNNSQMLQCSISIPLTLKFTYRALKTFCALNENYVKEC